VVEKGVEVVLASPKGGKAPLDPSSVEAFKDDEQCKKFKAEKLSLTENTEKLSSFVGKTDEFAAIFYVGGHGRECYIVLLDNVLIH
jgi:putative intracellular protease/amidase